MAFFSSRPSPLFSSKNILSPTVLLMGVALLASGCHPTITDPKDPKFIVAEKGTFKITRADLDKETSTYLKQHQMTVEKMGPAKMPALETALLDNMLLKEIFMEKAAAMQLKDVDKEEADTLNKIKGHYPSEAEFEAQLKTAGLPLEELKTRIHENVLIHRVLLAEVVKDVDPTEQEINDFYLQNKQNFVKNARVRASRILVTVDEKATPADKQAKKKAIDKAHDRVAHGEDFAKVAAEVSEDRSSAPNGGDLNFFQRGENEPQFDDVAFKTPVGKVSPVFETPLGYQFIKVTDSQPAGVATVAEARPAIANFLHQAKAEAAERAYAKKLLADKDVVYHLARVELPAPPAPGAANAAAPAPAPTPASTNAPTH